MSKWAGYYRKGKTIIYTVLKQGENSNRFYYHGVKKKLIHPVDNIKFLAETDFDKALKEAWDERQD